MSHVCGLFNLYKAKSILSCRVQTKTMVYFEFNQMCLRGMGFLCVELAKPNLLECLMFSLTKCLFSVLTVLCLWTIDKNGHLRKTASAPLVQEVRGYVMRTDVGISGLYLSSVIIYLI